MLETVTLQQGGVGMLYCGDRSVDLPLAGACLRMPGELVVNDSASIGVFHCIVVFVLFAYVSCATGMPKGVCRGCGHCGGVFPRWCWHRKAGNRHSRPKTVIDPLLLVLLNLPGDGTCLMCGGGGCLDQDSQPVIVGAVQCKSSALEFMAPLAIPSSRGPAWRWNSPSALWFPAEGWGMGLAGTSNGSAGSLELFDCRMRRQTSCPTLT